MDVLLVSIGETVVDISHVKVVLCINGVEAYGGVFAQHVFEGDTTEVAEVA